MAVRGSPTQDSESRAPDPAGRLLALATARGSGVRREGDQERPLGKKAARTRAELINAAYGVFAAQGYQGTAVADIAEAAGVSLGTFYQYFRDRADIMATIVSLSVADLLEGRRKPWDPARGRLGLRRVIAAFVEQYVATAPFQAVWQEVNHIDPEMAALHRDLTGVFTGTVEKALAEGAAHGLVRADLDPGGMARALTAMVDQYCYMTYVFGARGDDDRPSVDDTVDLLTELWADAIGLGSR